nr:MAG TPA: hypothetical protein [Caudoviricetes sp.]
MGETGSRIRCAGFDSQLPTTAVLRHGRRTS